MREILFRGKRQDNGEWVYGSFVPDLLEVYETDEQKGWTDWGFIKPFGKTKEERLMQYVERDSVGQYTGLTDKNGVKIFDGDILESHYDDLYPDDSAVETILWNKNGWCIKQGGHGDPDPLMEDGILPYSEVIGNIHDNRELLEGGDQA